MRPLLVRQHAHCFEDSGLYLTGNMTTALKAAIAFIGQVT
jgi:hypothetical protein